MTSQPPETDAQNLESANMLEADLARTLTRLGVKAGARVGVAVSGGADSMALLLLLKACGFQPIAFSLDHGLRAESKTEVQQVANWCAALNVPCRPLTWAGTEQEQALEGRNLQALARRARYRLLAEALLKEGQDTLLTAHHRDDQAETVFMRIARGSGIRGLAAIPQAVWLDASGTPICALETAPKHERVGAGDGPRPSEGDSEGGRAAKAQRAAVRLLRPLLSMSRESLRAYLQARGQAWIEDPSNENARFERVRVRRFLAGSEAATATDLGLTASRLAGLAAHAREAQDIEAWAVARACAETVQYEAHGWLRLNVGAGGHRWRSYPQAVRLRLLSSCITALTGADYVPRYDNLAALEQEMTASLQPQCAGARLDEAAFSGRTLAGVYIGPLLPRVSEDSPLASPAFYLCRESAGMPRTPLIEALGAERYATSYSVHLLGEGSGASGAHWAHYTLAPLDADGWTQLKQALKSVSMLSYTQDGDEREMAQGECALALDTLMQLPFPVRRALVGVWQAGEGVSRPRLSCVPQLGLMVGVSKDDMAQKLDAATGRVRPFEAGWLKHIELKWRDA